MANPGKKLRLTGKIFLAFVLVAVVPIVVASVAYYLVFSRLSSSVARQILSEKVMTARLILESRKETMGRRLKALARENMITVNAELGLASSLSGYLAEAADANGIDGIIVLDTDSLPFAGKAPHGRTLDAFAAMTADAAQEGDQNPEGLWAEDSLVSGTGKPLGTIIAFMSAETILEVVSRDISTPSILVSPGGKAVTTSWNGADISGFPASWEALGSGPAPAFRPASSGGERNLVAFLPLAPEAKGYWIGAAYSLKRLEMLRDGWTIVLGALLTVIIGLSLAASGYFSRSVTGPLRVLADAARRVTSGGLGVPGASGFALAGNPSARLDQDDEIGDLSRDFDAMARSLAAEMDEIEGMRGYLEDVVNSLPSALVTVDRNGAVTRLNEAAARLSELPPENAIGRFAWEVLPFLAPHRDSIADAILAREARELPQYRLPEDPPSARTTRYVEASIFPLAREEREAAVIRLEDVTELERKETELRQAQKMEMLGKLSTGIAHDFNNVLMGIIGTASLLALKLEGGETPPRAELAADAASILSIADRARTLVKQISRLSRKQELSLAEVDLKDSLESVARICANSFDKSIELRSSVPEGPSMTLADPVLIEQVVLNVCVNASHAMTIMRRAGEKAGGRLEISLEAVAADAHFLKTHALAREGRYWAIRISDSGVGMDDETIQRIFDPFFTTKDQGQGTGMGLATAYGIVRQHGGFIDVYSEPGAGSVFSIYLKAEDPSLGDEAVDRIEGTIRGTGRVVVLDDEETVRAVTAGMLAALGYAPVQAKNVREAEEALSSAEEGPPAAIIDMSMPGISGDEAFRMLKRAMPGLKAIIVSGYRHDARIDAAISEGAFDFLQKPYSLRDLSLSLHRMLAPPADPLPPPQADAKSPGDG